MAVKDKLSGEELDKRAAELNIEGRSDMTADEKRAAVEKAESDPKTRTDEALKDEREQSPGSFHAREGVPDGQQGPPEQDEFQPLQLVDPRARVEAKDRNMYVGLVHTTDDKNPSGDYVYINDLDAEEPTEVDGTPVKDAQVIGGASGLVMVLNGQAFHLGSIAGGILSDLQRAAQLKQNS